MAESDIDSGRDRSTGASSVTGALRRTAGGLAAASEISAGAARNYKAVGEAQQRVADTVEILSTSLDGAHSTCSGIREQIQGFRDDFDAKVKRLLDELSRSERELGENQDRMLGDVTEVLGDAISKAMLTEQAPEQAAEPTAERDRETARAEKAPEEQDPQETAERGRDKSPEVDGKEKEQGAERGEEHAAGEAREAETETKATEGAAEEKGADGGARGGRTSPDELLERFDRLLDAIGRDQEQQLAATAELNRRLDTLSERLDKAGADKAAEKAQPAPQEQGSAAEEPPAPEEDEQAEEGPTGGETETEPGSQGETDEVCVNAADEQQAAGSAGGERRTAVEENAEHGGDEGSDREVADRTAGGNAANAVNDLFGDDTGFGSTASSAPAGSARGAEAGLEGMSAPEEIQASAGLRPTPAVHNPVAGDYDNFNEAAGNPDFKTEGDEEDAIQRNLAQHGYGDIARNQTPAPSRSPEVNNMYNKRGYC